MLKYHKSAMNTGIINDALSLCLKIYNAVPPGDKWAIVNIARSSLPTFTYQFNSEIPTSFGYSFDNSPKLLTNEGVIEASTPKRWFTSVSKGNPTQYDMVRHDESYVPDVTILNPPIDALEHILKELYPQNN